MIFSALFVKFLSAGAVAQAATGATVAVVAFTGVGAVGGLPDPVQDTFATVVAEITPLEPPTSEEPTEDVASEEIVSEESASEEVAAEDLETTDEVADETVPLDAEVLEAQVKAWALDGPADGESIGEWVSKGSSADVKDWLRAHGMTFGNVVSAHASGKGFTEEELAVLGAGVGEPADAPTEPVSDGVDEVDESDEADDTAVAATTEDRGSRVNGNGNGSGNGNGKAAGGHGNGNGRGNGKN